MEKSILRVEGMSCAHCVKAVEGAVSPLPGVVEVKVDLAGGTVAVQHDPVKAPLSVIRQAIEDQGYDVVG